MATIRLVPSTYYLSSSTYLSVSNAANMYEVTDDSDTDYATVTNSQTGTTSYYIYIRGFNFDDVPSSATINSFTVKLRARESGISTSSSYAPKLCHGTSQITSTCSAITTTATTFTFTGVDADWEDIVGYGSDFGIRINCRRASRNTTGYMYIYGAEILVDYTVPNPATVTSTLTGNGTISPSGAYSTYDDAKYILTITPTDNTETVTATKDGTDITSQLVAHYPGATLNTDLGTYALVSGSFNGSGESYFQGIVGHGSTASQTTSNYYSGGSSTIAVFTYEMGFTVPSNAVIERVWCEVNGHAESTSQSSEYMCAMLISGSTNLSEELNFKDVGTSNSTQTIECITLPTVSQLASMKLQCRLGYYGGAINGATAHVTYSVPSGSGPEYYTYTYIVSGNATIAVVIGSQATNTLYIKENGTWVECVVYKKVNGSWVQQSDPSSVLDTSMNLYNVT